MMLRSQAASIVRAQPSRIAASLSQRRAAATQHTSSKVEGDISSVFRSLSGSDVDEKLPQRFAAVKQALATDKSVLHSSWKRLLTRLRDETETIKSEGPACIPQIDFADIDKPPAEFSKALRKRGVAVIRQVVPEKEARGYKEEIERYVAANPSTKGMYETLPV